MPPTTADRLEITALVPLMRVVQRHVPTDPPLPFPATDTPTDAEVDAILDWMALMKRRATDTATAERKQDV
jgi:hypothetical protein